MANSISFSLQQPPTHPPKPPSQSFFLPSSSLHTKTNNWAHNKKPKLKKSWMDLHFRLSGPLSFCVATAVGFSPRYPDGKLRYHGGHTRVLFVDTSVSFAELMVKMGEMCGSTAPVTLRCKLPTEDLDALVSITSDEDLAHLIEEYDLASSAAAAAAPPSFKIRAFLSVPKTIKRSVSRPLSSASICSSDYSPPKSPLFSGGVPPRYPISATRRFTKRSSRPPAYPIVNHKAAGKIPKQFAYQYYNGQGNSCGLFYLIHNNGNGNNIWQ